MAATYQRHIQHNIAQWKETYTSLGNEGHASITKADLYRVIVSFTMFSPVLFRELAGMSRRRGHYVLRAGVIGAVLGVIGLAWGREMNEAVNNGIMNYQALADGFFQLFCAAQLIVIVIITPGIVASVVAGATICS